jgi:putative DNA primase/helicase
MLWLTEKYDLNASTTTVNNAINGLAMRYYYHPVREYLDSLVWDGTARLDHWLIKHCGADDTPYTRAVGSKFAIGAVARIMEPGCKMDTALIFQGDQGLKKSESLLTLFGQAFYAESLPSDLTDKDAVQGLLATWGAELAELSQFKRSEVDDIKHFLTRRSDDIRLSYGRRTVKLPRHCVFAGTCNPDTFLRDETGNRRFWPVKIHKRCDVDGIRTDRDQLWAEALVRYRDGEKWYLEGDLEKMAEQEQAERMTVDPWTEKIEHYLEHQTLRRSTYKGEVTAFITGDEIMGDVLNIDLAKRDMSVTLRVASVLRMIGWRAERVENPTKGEKPRQLRAFIPKRAETAETGNEPSNLKPVSADEPLKTSSETGETGETLYPLSTVSEDIKEGEDVHGAGSMDVHDVENTSGFQLSGEMADSPVTPVSGPVTSNNSSVNSETGIESNLSPTCLDPVSDLSQPSHLTDKDPCPHCGGALKFFKPGQVYCAKQSAIKYQTTWQG